ncbi:phosphatidate cytidylyltransferase [Babesia gibsoni]|uniref:Phosphatidate cytidylyltransferase n=1 Tax=Babesia gibsoni TaxID=33632 RepID=A0AAD8LQ32_BABGI|nr:phosphatidate cytidylyltransferase [Babesia gibsoni]
MREFGSPSSQPDGGDAPAMENIEPKGTQKGKLPMNNLVLRTVIGLALFGGFTFVLSLGHVYCAILVLILISTAYYELIHLYDTVIHQKKDEGSNDEKAKGYTSEKYKKHVNIYVITGALDLLSFISLETYFLLTTMVGISLPWLLPRLARMHQDIARVCGLMLSYHHLLLFLAYIFGIIKFVLGLERGRAKQQFLRFAFIVVSLLYVVIQSMMIIGNIYYGMVWFILPHTMIILNDIMAYMFGKLVGRTPLISLSPKKTLEGFIGAFITTTLVIALVTPLFLDIRPMICPVNTFDFTPFSWFGNTCKPEAIYRTVTYVPPEWVSKTFGYEKILYKPCFVHIMILTLFACLLAPFGGFFASGFKRAIKVKDFSDTIPGHGGIIDRFDCHILMGSFTFLYLKTFVRRLKYNPDAIMKVISKMTPEDRAVLLEKLKEVFT